MRRSKLQMYLAVLEALALHGPMRLTRITYKANLSYGQLKPILKGLMKNELVQEKRLNKNVVVYAVTSVARTTLLRFKELTQILPII